MSLPSNCRIPLAALLVSTLWCGCGKEPVRTYSVKRDQPREAATATPAQPPAGAGMAGATLPGFSAPQDHGATWTAPAHWQAQPGNAVRIGSYKVAGADGAVADFSITVFPGDVGGDLANVNRWRQQIGLALLAQSDLAAVLQRVDAPAGTFLVVNFASPVPQPTRVFAAIFKQPERTWFFKLSGPDALVSAEESGFRALLASVRFAAAGANSAANSTNAPVTAPAPMSTMTGPSGTPGTATAPSLPAGHPPIGGAPSPASTSPAIAAPPAGPSSLLWAAPDHWVSKPLGAMRRGSFTVKNNAGEADCSIILLGAETNPLLDNVNRWRGQVSLPPVTAAQLPQETTTHAAGGLSFTVVDLVGRQPGGTAATRILGAVLYRGDEAWFFKLTGPDAVVAAEKSAFLEFLHTVRPAS